MGLTEKRKCVRRKPLNISTALDRRDIGGSNDDDADDEQDDEEEDGVEEDDGVEEEVEEEQVPRDDVEEERVDEGWTLSTAEDEASFMKAQAAGHEKRQDPHDTIGSSLQPKAERKSTPKISRVTSILQGMQTLQKNP